jgi:hypothetical protein
MPPSYLSVHPGLQQALGLLCCGCNGGDPAASWSMIMIEQRAQLRGLLALLGVDQNLGCRLDC